MAKVTMTVCDVCGGDDGVETWAIHSPEASWKADLCPEHQDELRECLTPFGHRMRESSTRKAHSAHVIENATTMDEVRKRRNSS